MVQNRLAFRKKNAFGRSNSFHKILDDFATFDDRNNIAMSVKHRKKSIPLSALSLRTFGTLLARGFFSKPSATPRWAEWTAQEAAPEAQAAAAEADPNLIYVVVRGSS